MTKNKSLELSDMDMDAIKTGDSKHINNKGAKLYEPKTYKESVEYYRLGAAMGDAHSISNLGYCYLYGRYIEQNTSLAIAYFMIAAKRGDIDATYKLGDIYSKDKWVKKDIEMSNYYFDKAASILIEDSYLEYKSLKYVDGLDDYPSLCLALGVAMSRGGSMNTDLDLALEFLINAEIGYEKALRDGNAMYEPSYERTLKLISDHQFDKIREKHLLDYSDDDEDDDFDDDFDEDFEDFDFDSEKC